MAFFPNSGKHKCAASNKTFAATLGASTALKIAISGKMNGYLGGFALTGFGTIEYTYVQGATEWVRTDLDGSAQGPATIPVGSPAPGAFSLVYDPKGKCSAKVSIDVTGDADVSSTGFKFKHKKDVWKMKGRTDTLTINISQSVAVDCEAVWNSALSALTSAFTCEDYDAAGSGLAWVQANLSSEIAAVVAEGCGDQAEVEAVLAAAADAHYAGDGACV